MASLTDDRGYNQMFAPSKAMQIRSERRCDMIISEMKLTKDSLRQIRQFARERIGGFGMWIELRENVTYIGDVDNSSGKPDWRNVESIYHFNKLH